MPTETNGAQPSSGVVKFPAVVRRAEERHQRATREELVSILDHLGGNEGRPKVPKDKVFTKQNKQDFSAKETFLFAPVREKPSGERQRYLLVNTMIYLGT